MHRIAYVTADGKTATGFTFKTVTQANERYDSLMCYRATYLLIAQFEDGRLVRKWVNTAT